MNKNCYESILEKDSSIFVCLGLQTAETVTEWRSFQTNIGNFHRFQADSIKDCE